MSVFSTTLKIAAGLAVAMALCTSPALAAGHSNAEEAKAPPGGFSFEGPLGKFDQGQLQRGYKVYREVCASCHSMNLLSFRNLAQKGGPFYDEEYKNPNDNPIVKQIASEYDIPEIDPDTGDEVTRKGTTSDRFPSPFKNDEAAKASNGGAIPPDLSVITKAREGGAAYIYSLVNHNGPAPVGLNLNPGQYYYPHVNGSLAAMWTGKGHAPKGGVLAMPPPLAANKVSFDDGTPSTLSNQARDVAVFLEWAADPHAEERKQIGLAVIAYLLLLAGIVYIAYRQVWKGKH